MDAYNQLLYIILTSFGIDIESISIDDAFDALLEEGVKQESVDKAVKESVQRIKAIDQLDHQKYEQIIMTLVRDYISKEPKSDSAMIKLLKMLTKKETIDSFTQVPSFADDLIVNFIYNLFTSDNKLIVNFDNLSLLQKFSDNITVDYLNDVMRSTLNRIRTYFESPERTFEFIETIYYNDVNVSDKALQNAITVLKSYQNMLMRIVYADVYEYLLTLDDSNTARKHIKSYIEKYVSKGDFSLNPSFGMENETIFSYFFNLNREKRNVNHQIVNPEQKDYLRGVNPLYMIEASGIIKK